MKSGWIAHFIATDVTDRKRKYSVALRSAMIHRICRDTNVLNVL